MSETRNKSYRELTGVSQKQQSVLSAIEVLKVAFDKDIAKYLGWEINRVTGRRNELVDLDKIEEVGKFHDPSTNRMIMRYRVKAKSIVMPAFKDKDYQYSLL